MVKCEKSQRAVFIFVYAECDPPCENEGRCTQHLRCRCTNGWNGTSCQQRRKPVHVSYCRIPMSFLHALSLQLSVIHPVKMGSVIGLITVSAHLVGKERAAGNVI